MLGKRQPGARMTEKAANAKPSKNSDGVASRDKFQSAENTKQTSERLNSSTWGSPEMSKLLRSSEKSGDKRVGLGFNQAVKIEDSAITKTRANLNELAEKKMGRDEFAQFKKNEALFEKRVDELEQLYRKQHPEWKRERALSEAYKEVGDTYKQITKLLQVEYNPQVPLVYISQLGHPTESERHDDERQRTKLASQILDHAAKPTAIDQGYHNTCNVSAAAEVRAYVKRPSQAARLVVDMATTGEYKSHSGIVVSANPGSLIPHDEAAREVTAYGQRNHASQIFQVTAVNLSMKRLAPEFQYQQQEPVAGQKPADGGERIYDMHLNPIAVMDEELHPWHPGDKTPIRSDPGQFADLRALPFIGNDILGDKVDDHSWCVQAQHPKWKDYTNYVDSADKLENTVAKAMDKGNLPMTILVYTGNEPFLSDSQQAGWHVVNVTGYDAKTAKVKVDNQWGAKKDREMTIADLFNTMQRRKPQ